MNKTPSKIKILIFGLCGMIFLILNFGFGAKLQIGLTENLQKITNYYFAISSNTLDYLILASVPFFGMIYNSKRSELKKFELIKDIFTILFSVIIVIGIGFFLMIYLGRSSNPLIPDFLLTEPFDLYSTLLIGIGVSIPFLILKLIKKHNIK